MTGNGGWCTYLIGRLNCSDAVASCAYLVPYFANTVELAQGACSILVDKTGNYCGFTPNTPNSSNCAPRVCT